MAPPLHQNPSPGVMKFTILVDPSLVIITVNNVLSLSDLCLIFKEIHQFYIFYPKIISHWRGGYGIYNFLSPNSTYASYLIWFRLAE